MIVVVFDLDGTLIDNEHAVREAYAQAGVTMPDGAWGKPVGNWCTSEQHHAKQEAYKKCLIDFAKTGPGMRYWESCLATKLILTGASHKSAYDALDFLGISHAYLSGAGLSLTEKSARIRGIQKFKQVLYVDSDRGTAETVAKETQCQILIPV